MGDQGVQQMQQPIVVYPNAYTKQYPDPSSSSSSSSSGSRGSFGTVFIVLAVILVLSVLACVFGRLCKSGSRMAKQPKQHSKLPKHEKGSSKKSREIRPVEREPRERGDLDFGFDMKRPEPIRKPSGGEGEDIEFGFDNKRGERAGGGLPPPPSIKHGVRFKLPENGEHHSKGETRHGGPEFQFRPGHQ